MLDSLLQDLPLIRAELWLTASAFVLLTLTMFSPREMRRMIGYVGIACLAVTLFFLFQVDVAGGMGYQEGFSRHFVLDGYGVLFKMLFAVAAMLTILMSLRYLDLELAQSGEFYSLILLAVVGMMFMVSGRDLITIYIGLETMALSSYVMAGYLKGSRKSNEAAAKYFLLGGFSSAIFLYGMSLLYGATGTTNLAGITRSLTAQIGAHYESLGQPMPALAAIPYEVVRDALPGWMFLGVVFILIGLGFKVAAVPFHMWAPDVYEGAPTSIAAFLSTASKAVSFAALLRILVEGLYPLHEFWTGLLAFLAVVSMTLGNVTALLQENTKRMLAYSSIAHAGYSLMAVVAVGAAPTEAIASYGVRALIIYLIAYTFTNLGAFSLVILLRRQEVIGDRIIDFSGLSRKHPFGAFSMLVFMLSLAGIPATAGFIGKWYLFGAAVDSNYVWLAVVAVVNSAISAYYYLRVIVQMYVREPLDGEPLRVAPELNLAIGLSLLFTFWIGLFPEWFIGRTGSSLLSLTRMF